MNEVQVFLSALSAFSSFASAIFGYRASGYKELPKEELGRIESESRVIAYGPDDEGVNRLMTVINGDLLRDLTKQIKDAQEHIKSIAGGTHQPEVIDMEIDIASRKICFVLEIIKKRNDGVLPIPELYRVWRENRCG